MMLILSCKILQTFMTWDYDRNAVEYGLSLNAAPTSTVEITVDMGDDLMADPVSLIFTKDGWSVMQTVTVSASEDSFGESTENIVITHAK
jgi:hypothetical protein